MEPLLRKAVTQTKVVTLKTTVKLVLWHGAVLPECVWIQLKVHGVWPSL